MFEILAFVCSFLSAIFAAYHKNIHALLGWICAMLYAAEKVFV